MGIKGAAWATIVSDGLGALLLFIIAVRRGLIKFKLGWACRDHLGKLWNLTLPVLGERALIASAVMLFNAIILHYSVAAYAATQIVFNIEAFSFLPGMAYMQTAQIMVGQNLGANNPGRAVRSGYQSVKIALGIMSLFGLTFLLFPTVWVSIFTNDPEVVPMGIYVCRMAAALQPVLFIGAWMVRLVLAATFAYILKLEVYYVWWTMFIDWAVRSLLAFWRYRKGGWKLSNGIDT